MYWTPVMADEQPLLNVKGLRIGFPGPGSKLIEVVKGIDFSVGTEKVALVASPAPASHSPHVRCWALWQARVR